MSSISGSSSKGKQSLSLQSEQTGGHPFDDWLANERKACRSAISLLSEPRVIRILRFRRDGCLSVRECSFQVLFPPSSSSSSTSAGQTDEGPGFGSEFGLSDGREIFLAYDLLPEVRLAILCKLKQYSKQEQLLFLLIMLFMFFYNTCK